MEFCHQLFLLALLLPLVNCADPIYHRCDQNFTNNNSLQDSINLAIFTLIAQTPSAGYAISTVGTDASTVYGLTQCRGDISPRACSDCITPAAKELRGSCPYSASSRVWYDLCKLRYDTANFHGNMDITDMMGGGTRENAGIPKEFDNGKWQLLNWVKVGAASANNRFAMGKRSIIGQNITIYGMAQCTADLQGLTCMECLEELANEIRAFCSLREGCFYKASSCDLRYEAYNFFSNDVVVPEQPENAIAYAPAPSALG